MQPRKFCILSAATAGSLALAAAVITASPGTSRPATHAALAAQTQSFPPVNLDACPALHTGYPTGECVAQLQTDLNIIQNNHLAVDGTFGSTGSQTYQAVIAFQQAKHLEQDGIVGPATKQALDAALSGPNPAAPPATAPAPNPSQGPPTSFGTNSAANPTQTCATLGEAGDDISGSSEGDHSVFVGDPATLVVESTNVLPETVVFTPDGGATQTAILWRWNSSHTFHLPAPGALQTPYAHSFSVKVDGVRYDDSTSAQMLGFVKSSLCQDQRLLTATQVPGTGIAPASGTGSLSFKVHLSAPAPLIGADNPDPFVIEYSQQAQNGTADPVNGINGSVTIPPGSQDATITVPIAAVPPGNPASSIEFLLSGNDKHVPTPILFTGTSAPAPNVFYPGEQLNPGEQLTSPNARYALVMQSDGNLVEYDAGTPIWASNTAGHPGSDFEAQPDGNFVVYAPGHTAIWESNTSGRTGSVLKIQDDGNVVIYAPGNIAIWTSNTAV
jgi:peptidoglycan hydrolase-like protein with peptidoglycan-binding domain